MIPASAHPFRPSLPRRSRRSTFALLAILCLILSVVPGSVTAGSPAVSIANVTISNLNDVKFTVSWTTDSETNGLVRWGTTPGALTEVAEDPISFTSTHYVTIEDRTPSTQYFFQVESDGVIGNNNGVPYSVITGPTLGLPSPGAFIYGYGYVETPAVPLANAIVFLRIEDNNGSGTPGVSQWLSARTDATGGWYYSLSGVRTETAGAYFSFTEGADNLYFWGEGGIYGRAGVQPIEDVVPVPGVPTQLPGLRFRSLAITLTSFSATAEQDGMRLTWETASEIDNQGFNLYRAMDSAGPQDLLAFVPSQAPGSNQGASYEWLDTDVTAGGSYFYWLEAVDLSGATTLHGPVSATYQAPTAVDVTTFTAQAMDNSVLTPLLLALSALLGGAAYGLRRRSRRLVAK